MNKKIKALLLGILILCFFYLLYLCFPFFSYIKKTIFPILKPFLYGVFIAIILQRTMKNFESCHLSRTISAGITTILFYGIFLLGIFLIVPILIHTIQEFIIQLDQFEILYLSIIEKIYSSIPFLKNIDMESILLPILKKISIQTLQLEKFSYFFRNIGLLLLIPTITFFSLKELESWKQMIYSKKKESILVKVFPKIEDTWINYTKGLLIDFFVLTILSYILFSFFGIKNALFLALIIGITNMIPVIGQYFGGFIVAFLVLPYGIDKTISVTIIIVTLQLLESNILSVYIQSKTTKTPELIILLGFLIFSYFLGMTGMLFSTPIISSLYILYKEYKSY